MFRQAIVAAMLLCACTGADDAGLFGRIETETSTGGAVSNDAAVAMGDERAVTGSGGAGHGGHAVDAGPGQSTGGVSSIGGAQQSGAGGFIAMCAALTEVLCYGPGACRGTKLCNGDGSGWGPCYCLQGSGGTSAGTGGGSSCSACGTPPANAVTSCVNGVCDFACLSGFTRNGWGCTPNSSGGTGSGGLPSCLDSACPDSPCPAYMGCGQSFPGGCACFCSSGRLNCDGNLANGCEVESDVEPNCGACGVVCNTLQTGKTCKQINGQWGCH